MKKKSLVLLIALTALVAGASATAQDSQPSDYVIGPQDVLAIQLMDQPELGGRYTVEADGTFNFPLIGRIKASGQTLRQFEADLRARLADGYFRNPQVSVGIQEYHSKSILVMGEVRSAGQVTLTGGMSLLEALARAGGALPTASGDVSVVRQEEGKAPSEQAEIFRATLSELQSGALRENIDLRDGDTIFVLRAESIYVFGEVKNPNAYPIQRDTTVLQALSLAGGATEHAALNRIKIARIENGKKVEVRVELTDIVRPGDTIIVPQRYF